MHDTQRQSAIVSPGASLSPIISKNLDNNYIACAIGRYCFIFGCFAKLPENLPRNVMTESENYPGLDGRMVLLKDFHIS